jgi:mersacidin/lichenicidin family type 2 lantibiotic
MNKDIVRAWKDPMTRERLSGADLGFHPAGLIELSDRDLREASGQAGPALTTAIDCTESSFRGWRACCP